MKIKQVLGFDSLDDSTFEKIMRMYLYILLLLMVICFAVSSCTSTWFIQKNNTGTSATNSTETSVDSTKINLTPNLQLPK